MKTAGRENLSRWVAIPSHRARGAEDQNKSCLDKGAEKQEKLQPLEWCFFLTSPFIEYIRLVYDRRFLREAFENMVSWIRAEFEKLASESSVVH